MMYISAFPITITMRNSNVYEERSLGIYSDHPDYDAVEKEVNTVMGWVRKRLGTASTDPMKRYFVQQQLRAQLGHDLWWLALAVFVIMIIEGSQFKNDPADFSVFNVIFEVVSGKSHQERSNTLFQYTSLISLSLAYGTVGISIGLPTEAYSFSGAWHTLSKLILCAVMLRGRHRGLPVAIDKAIMLPRDHHDLEEEDAHIRSENRSIHDGIEV
jgi:Trk-type K+ transport system membrane component